MTIIIKNIWDALVWLGSFLAASGLIVFLLELLSNQLKDRDMRKKIIKTLLLEYKSNIKTVQKTLELHKTGITADPKNYNPYIPIIIAVGYLDYFIKKHLFIFTYKDDDLLYYFDELKNKVIKLSLSPTAYLSYIKDYDKVLIEYYDFLQLAVKHNYDFNFSYNLIKAEYREQIKALKSV